MRISGATQLAFIIGDPVAQVKAPEVLNALFNQCQRNIVLVPLHVPSPDLPRVWESLRVCRNLIGLCVTMPHKVAAAGLCDKLGVAARSAAAVNVVRRTADGRMIGDLFDGAGFVAGLKAQNHAIIGQSVLIIGAGGAAIAIGIALIDEGAASIAIRNRTEEKARMLVKKLKRLYPDFPVTLDRGGKTDADIIVNATSLGMRNNDPFPVAPETISARTLVTDLIMTPDETSWLRRCRERGCAVHHGRHMLIHQAYQMAEFFLRPEQDHSSRADEWKQIMLG